MASPTTSLFNMKKRIPTRLKVNPSRSSYWKWLSAFLLVFCFTITNVQGQFSLFRCLSPAVNGPGVILYGNGSSLHVPGETYTFRFWTFSTRSFVSRYVWKLNDRVVGVTSNREFTFTLPPLDDGIHWIEVVPVNFCGIPNPNEGPFRRPIRVTNPCEPNVALEYTGAAGEICAGNTYSYRLANAVDVYTWSVSNGATLTPSGNQASISYPSEGTYTITATKDNNPSCVYTLEVSTQDNPANIQFVDGLLTSCQGNTEEYTIIGSQNATSFDWTFPTGVTHLFQDAQRRTVLITYPNTGSFPISITPQNDCGAGNSTSFTVNVEQNFSKVREVALSHTELNTLPSQDLVVNTCSERASACLGQLKKVDLRAWLDLGDHYDWGEQEFNTTVTFTLTGLNASNGALFTHPGELSINSSAPRSLYTIVQEANLQDLRSIRVEITNYTITGPVESAVRLRVAYEDVMEISVVKTELDNFQAVSAAAGDWNVNFSWTSNCQWVDNYQLRLLKIFDGQSVPGWTSPRWADALVVDTESGDTFVELALAEGSGQYAWQVRPVGNKKGATANADNLVDWPEAVQVLNFTQPDEDKNYIYSRTFTEGNRVSEQLTFATGLQQVRQQQTRIQEEAQVVATNTLQDLSGRDVLQSLPVPVKGKTLLGYEPGLVSTGTSSYSPGDFDDDAKIYNPSPAYLDKEPSNNGYYGGTSNGINDQVPDAEGFPYTRSLYMNDGTGRLKAQSGVGLTHSMKGPRTVRYFYTGVAQEELDFMFGEQAPVAANTRKEITVDANNTASVSYRAKDGTTVATALAIGNSTGNTEELDSNNPSATRSIRETIVERALIGNNTSSTQKELVFTVPTDLIVDYTLSPGIVEELCSGTCQTCDYLVSFILHNKDNPSNTSVLTEFNIEAMALDCSQKDTVYSKLDTIPDLSGNFILEKRVKTSNRSVEGSFYLDNHLDSVETHYRDELSTIFTPIDAYLRGEQVDLDGLYSYLDQQGYVPIPNVDGEEFYQISVGCDGEMINIPRILDDCGLEPDCSTLPTFDFVQHFLDYWTQELERSPREPGTFDPLEVLPQDGYDSYRFLAFRYSPTQTSVYLEPAEFNTMMSNLLQETDGTLPLYNCQLVWEVWLQQVQNYEFLSTTQPGPEDTPEGYDLIEFEYNFIDNFLLTLESRLGEIETDTVRQIIRKEGFYTGTPSKPTRENLYKLFYYDPDDPAMSNCMTGYISRHNQLDTANSCEQSTLEEQFQCLSYQQRHVIYQCVTYSDYTYDGDAGIRQVKQALLVNQCRKSCADNRQAFTDAVVNDLHNKLLYIEGDAFLLELDPARQINVLIGDPRDPQVFDVSACELEAMVDALEANCESYCQVDFVFDPISSEIIGAGTDHQQLNIQKVLTSDFDIVVNTAQETVCPAPDWDYLPPQGSVPDIEVPSYFQFVDPFVEGSTAPDIVFTVTNTNDDLNPGSFRYALQQANLDLSPNKAIVFDLNPADNPHTISITSPLPAVTMGGLKIDGLSQPTPTRSTTNPSDGLNIIFDFRNLSVPDAGFTVQSGNVVIIGLEIFTKGHGIYVINSTEVDLGANIIQWFEDPLFDYATQPKWPVVINNSSKVDVGANIIGADFSLVPSHQGDPGILITGASDITVGTSGFDGELGNTIAYGNYINGTIDLRDNVSSSFDVNVYYNELVSYNPVAGNHLSSINSNSADSIQYSFNTIGRKLAGTGTGIWMPVALGMANMSKAPPVITNIEKITESFFRVFGTGQPGDEINVYVVNTRSVNETTSIEYMGYIGDVNEPISTSVDVNGNWQLEVFDTKLQAGVFRMVATGESVSRTSGLSNIYTFGAPASTCNQVFPLCFRFSDTPLDIQVPEGFKPYVFEAEPFTCEQVNANSIIASLDYQQNQYVNHQLESFRDAYNTSCGNPVNVNDNLTLTYNLGYHHYTLYYYDRAGNLMRTIPPKGFSTTNPDAHTMETGYHYNSLGQLVKQYSPDGGETKFYYNDLGQLRFSQNAKQALDSVYSYTLYDPLGRIIEVGESQEGIDLFTRMTNAPGFPVQGTQKTRTIYSDAYGVALFEPQRFLQNRVSYTYLDEDGSDLTLEDRTYTIYSYDPHGNVEWLVQSVPGLGEKLIQYEYDLLSGNVLQVKYNPGQPDQFYHQYEYDVDNRIKKVLTSADGELWDRDAEYHYYAHGPLKQAIIGHDKVQQLDYVYTIHGWLKAINNPAGQGAPAGNIGVDAFAMALNYYSGDYKRNGSTIGELAPPTGRDLFNGNISAWEMGTHASDDSWMRTGFQYAYDELNRIKDSRFNVNREGTFYDRGGFHADFTLDANGNLETLNRNDIDAVNFDALTYHLQAGNNRLDHVVDNVADTALHTEDIESQDLGNYHYDAIGNLTRDEKEAIDIDWTVYGKVDALNKADGPGTQFMYDAAGNRVRKQTTDGFGNVYSTYYVRDASGNIMATYRRQDIEGVAGTPHLIEIPLYGSDRLGNYTPGGATTNTQQPVTQVSTDLTVNSYQGVSYSLDQGVTLTLQPGFSFEEGKDGKNFNIAGTTADTTAAPPNVHARTLDLKQYELKDHLGNVRAVVTDRKQSTVSGTTPADFRPSIVSAMAYYPYGMDLPTVHWFPDTAIATMEPADALIEIPEFENYTSVAIINNMVFNHTQTFVNQGVDEMASHSFLLTAKEDSIIGLAKSLRVQAGDKITTEVYGKYESPEDANDLTNVGVALGNAFVDAFGFPATQEGMALGEFFSDLFAAGIPFVGDDNNTEQVDGYLNYLLFDDDYVLVNAGFTALSNAARQGDTPVPHERLALQVIPQQDGYLYIYTSNESPARTKIYFDDFTVIHEKLVPDVAYDPDLVGYRYGFNGKEKDQVGEWGLNHYDYGFRIYNPALGRFLSVDPLTRGFPELTPYQFASNTPIDGIDLDGLEYLDADEALIESKYGRIELKLDNFNYVFRTNWWIANMDPKNWRTNEIGLNPTIGYLDVPEVTLEDFHPELALSVPNSLGEIKNPALHGKNGDPTFDPAEIKIELRKNRFGVPDQRLKEKTIQGISSRNRGSGTAAVGVANIISVAFEFYALYGFGRDRRALEDQINNVLPNAIFDLKEGIREGIVPDEPEFQNSGALGAILNVILTGENPTDNPRIEEIGLEIIEKVSGNLKKTKPKRKRASEPRFRRYGEE